MGTQKKPQTHTTETPEFQLHVCGQKCFAGGKPEHDGHVFNIPWESEDGLFGGFTCKCGLDNISFSMMAGDE